MAIGANLALINVTIRMVSALIVLTTTLMATIGIIVGACAKGTVMGHRAEIFGGLTLISVGAWMLYGHLYLSFTRLQNGLAPCNLFPRRWFSSFH
ncbi:manganese efflux pump [Paraglaciecola chathamensis]|jgi:putative Mn2+ efflux pump MntP|uniref:manganese efflux pump n=1 Tax=Paraglaciecola chathamensis TaxID=368405 RepID=UPI001780A15E